jgi:MFS family permease
MSTFLYIRKSLMSYEEKSAWTYGIVSLGAYVAYLAIVLGQTATTPLVEVEYVAPLLWTVGASIVAAIVINILIGIVTGMRSKRADTKDTRDRQIYRFGEYIGRGVIVGGAIAALLLAILELDYFWIANVLYLAFVLSALVGTVVKVVAYRRGFQPW